MLVDYVSYEQTLDKGNLWKEDTFGSQLEDRLCQQKDFQRFLYEQLKF